MKNQPSNKPLIQIPDDNPENLQTPNTRFDSLYGMYDTISSVPTHKPKTPQDQIKFYSSGSTYRLYIFDKTNNVWRYTALT